MQETMNQGISLSKELENLKVRVHLKLLAKRETEVSNEDLVIIPNSLNDNLATHVCEPVSFFQRAQRLFRALGLGR
jgi:hypothetical protein